MKSRKSFLILVALFAGAISAWAGGVTSPPSAVRSVNGQTGDVSVQTSTTKISTIGKNQAGCVVVTTSDGQQALSDPGLIPDLSGYAMQTALNNEVNRAMQAEAMKATAAQGAKADTALQSETPSDWNATSGAAAIANKPTIPTKISQLTNDSNFLTVATIPAATSTTSGTMSAGQFNQLAALQNEALRFSGPALPLTVGPSVVDSVVADRACTVKGFRFSVKAQVGTALQMTLSLVLNGTQVPASQTSVIGTAATNGSVTLTTPMPMNAGDVLDISRSTTAAVAATSGLTSGYVIATYNN